MAIGQFSDLPNEVLTELFIYIPVNKIGVIRITCRAFNEQSKVVKLWEAFALPLGVKNSENQSWEEAVKERIIFLHEEARKQRVSQLPVMVPPPPFPFPPGFPKDDFLLFKRKEKFSIKDYDFLFPKLNSEEFSKNVFLALEMQKPEFLMLKPQLQLFDPVKLNELMLIKEKTLFEKITESIEEEATHIINTVANFFKS